MSVKTQLILRASGDVDLYDDIPFTLNYSIADIKEPNKRHGHYSKTITVPGTNNNNILFAHIYEIGVDRLYNTNKRASGVVMIDGQAVFTGSVQLLSINKLRDKKIDYSLIINGEVANIFNALEDKKLTDLDFSDLNHNKTKTIQKGTWSAPTGAGYVYPFIDYGYSYNEIDYSVDNFHPAIYLKEYVDRIFSFAKMKYSSAFFTSAFFKRLIVPFNSDNLRLSGTQIDNRKFKASRETTEQLTTVTSSNWNFPSTTDIVNFNDDTSGSNQDLGDVFNTGTGKFVAPAHGRYNFKTTLTVYGKATFNANSKFGRTLWIVVNIKNNTTGDKIAVSQIVDLIPGKEGLSFNSGQVVTGADKTIAVQTPAPVFVKSGQEVIVWIEADAAYNTYYQSQANSDVTWEIFTKTGSSFESTPDPTITEGGLVTMNDGVPSNLKMKDLLISVIKMFNLYMSTDKDDISKYIVEPRNDYYLTTTQDWSNKFDVSKEVEIKPMGAQDVREYLFTYKKDTDYFNTRYFDKYGEVYGHRKKEIVSDFVKGSTKTEVLFSATPLYSSGASNRKYPKIISVDKDGVVTPVKSNIRILHFNGTKSSDSWNYTSELDGLSVETTYPYCGHIDDPAAPTIDLSFGVPREIYYIPSFNDKYTNNNIYNKYWKQFIDEITDKNSSIVTAWFRLHPSDIMSLNFRHLYFFMGNLFRLNKIYDYSPIKEDVTKCEFLKIKSNPPVVLKTDIIGGGKPSVVTDDSTDTTTLPYLPYKGTRGNQIIDPVGNFIHGSRNTVATTSENIFVLGNNNVIGEKCRNISIINSSGITVVGGLDNVLIKNSSGILITESNVTYERNFKSGSQRKMLRTITKNDTASRNDSVILAEPNNGSITYTLPNNSVAATGDDITGALIVVKNVSSSGTVILDPAGAQTIDGKPTLNLNPGESITLMADGSNYQIVERTSKMATLTGGAAKISPSSSTTYFFGQPVHDAMTTTSAIRRINIPTAGIIKKVYLSFTATGTGSDESSTISVRKNDTSDTEISAALKINATYVSVSKTDLSISVEQGDFVEVKWVTPAWGATPPTGVTASVTIFIE